MLSSIVSGVSTLTEAQLLECLERISGVAASGLLARARSSSRAALLASFELDSLAVLELGIHLEDHYGVFVNPSGFPVDPAATVHDLLTYINGHGSSSP